MLLALLVAAASPRAACAQDKPKADQGQDGKAGDKGEEPDEEPDKKADDKKDDDDNKPPKEVTDKAYRKLQAANRLARVDVKKAEKFALEALEIYPDYEQARTFLGWLYNVRLGDYDKAMEQYDYLIRKTKNRKIRADALANKATLTFIAKRDFEAAIELYKTAGNVLRSWRYADQASNLHFHISNFDKAEHNARLALKRLEGYIKRTEKNRAVKPEMRRQRLESAKVNLIKVKVHLAACCAANGKDAESKKLIESCDEFPRAVKYNLALLRAVQKSRTGVINCLVDYMKTRDTPKARNLLRKFILEEPVFRKWHQDKDFKKITKNEPEKD